MTYQEFVKEVKQMCFPDREESNLVTNHTRYILDGLIEIQKRVPQLRDRNFNSTGFGDTFYQCRATIVDPKPDGPLIRLYTYTEPDHCDRIYYHPTTREHMENLMKSCGVGVPPAGPLVGPEPKDYHPALGSVDLNGTHSANGSKEVEPIIVRIEFNPSILIGGSSATGILDLLEPAPSGGATIALASEDVAVVQVPSVVTIPFGETHGTFPITTTEVPTSRPVSISAALGSRIVALELQVHDSTVDTDKGYRSSSGYYAVIGAQVFVWPHIESNEQVVIEWSGIKRTYRPTDEINFDKDVQSAVELYVQAQAALREDCDHQKYVSLQTAWQNQASMLTWWYRKKELLPESPWREPECDPCATTAATTDDGGTVPPPDPTTFTVYLGNAGPDAPESYTEAGILAMENGEFGITRTRSVVLGGGYQISRPASNLNEYRLVCLPTSEIPALLAFRSAGLPLPMHTLPDQVAISGVNYTIYRTTGVSAGDFSSARGSAIEIVLA